MTEVPSVQVVVPGKSDFTLLQTGKYTIDIYEYRSIVGNRVYSTGEDVPSIQVNLVSRDTGSEISLSNTSMNSTYTVGSRSGIGIFDFSIDKPEYMYPCIRNSGSCHILLQLSCRRI
jgi:hypothetical protein